MERAVDVEQWECTSEEYHRDPSLSQSKIKHFRDDREDFYERDILHSVYVPSTKKFQQFGLDTERLMFYGVTPGVLIPQEVLRRNEVDGKERFTRAGVPWREFKARMEAEHGPDVELLKADEWDQRWPPSFMSINSNLSDDW